MKVIEWKYEYTGRRLSESHAKYMTLMLVQANGCLKSNEFFVSKTYGLTFLRRWVLNSSYCSGRGDFKFIVPLNAFTVARSYSAPNPAASEELRIRRVHRDRRSMVYTRRCKPRYTASKD